LQERQNFATFGRMETNILEFVKGRLTAAKGQWPTICRETGLRYSWLSKFAQDRIPNPGITKIQRLADYFQRETV
jgi:transcriptional regulator with XRE-family HTH domain